MADGIAGSLKEQGAAVLVLLAVGITAILAMVVLQEFHQVASDLNIGGQISTNVSPFINNTVLATITAFIAGFALFGTFATITALVIVVKAVVGVVKGMQ